MCTGLVCKLHNWPADSFKFLMIFGSVLQSNNKAIGVRSNKIWIQRKQAMIWFALTVYLFFFHAIVAVGSQLPCPSTVSVQIEVMDQNSATNSSSKFLAAEGKSLDRWVLFDSILTQVQITVQIVAEVPTDSQQRTTASIDVFLCSKQRSKT